MRTKPMLAAAAATLAVGGAGLAALPTGSAAAATAPSMAGESANWAGYVAQGRDFSAVSGSWVQPEATCPTGTSSTYSAFWVGLGGASDQSQALEQVGTQADCSSSGQASYYAWYELVPAAPVNLGMRIHPGDRITGTVRVKGTQVTVSLADHTSGQTVTRRLQTADIDTTSAEWIAEAPSACTQMGDCQPLPLADFGTVSFTDATATADGHTGPISDPAWRNQAVVLTGSSAAGGLGDGTGIAYEPSVGGGGAGAQPSGLSGDGASFSVSWQGSSDTSSAAGAGGGGYDYAYGPAPGWGDGYGYGLPY